MSIATCQTGKISYTSVSRINHSSFPTKCSLSIQNVRIVAHRLPDSNFYSMVIGYPMAHRNSSCALLTSCASVTLGGLYYTLQIETEYCAFNARLLTVGDQ